jgi:N-acetylmuramoyl-L-alanine amidase
VDNAANPATADAYSGAWARDANTSRRAISIGQAKASAGAVLIRKPAAGGIGHVAISQGDGSTVEAHSEKRGVTNDSVDGRRWDLAMLVPLLVYPDELSTTVFQPPQGLILRLTFPPMQGALVKKMQATLKSKGFDPGGVDGIFGPHTEAAVRGFQLQSGLVPDGEAGPKTLNKLGL